MNTELSSFISIRTNPSLGIHNHTSQANLYITEHLRRVYSWSNSTSSSHSVAKDDLPRLILATLQAARFCENRFQDPSSHLLVMNSAIKTGSPIPISLVCGPLKNRRLGVRQSPDWAEFFQYSQLAKIALAVREIYPPGIEVEVILDDARAGFANQVETPIFDEYRAGLEALLSHLGLFPEIVSIVSQREVYNRLRVLEHTSAAEYEVDRFLSTPEGERSLPTLIRNASENNCSFDNSESSARRYLIAQKAEILAGFWTQSGRIFMRYGRSPDFVPRLWSVSKGSGALPWQGIGGLVVLPNGEVRPCVWQPYRACGLEHIGRVEIFDGPRLLPNEISVFTKNLCPSRNSNCGECV